MVGSELRSRTMPMLQDSIVTTQWGDGFGAASCELAHLALESFANLAKLRGKSAVRVFVDAVQAYPSLVVALALPLPLRTRATKQLLVDAGFSADEAMEVIAEQHDLTEWEEVSEHLRRAVASFQEAQWSSSDFSEGVATAMVGASAGLPLAGVRTFQNRTAYPGGASRAEPDHASGCC